MSFQMGDHINIIFNRMQISPWEIIFPRQHVTIIRLVHMPAKNHFHFLTSGHWDTPHPTSPVLPAQPLWAKHESVCDQRRGHVRSPYHREFCSSDQSMLYECDSCARFPH